MVQSEIYSAQKSTDKKKTKVANDTSAWLTTKYLRNVKQKNKMFEQENLKEVNRTIASARVKIFDLFFV